MPEIEELELPAALEGLTLSTIDELRAIHERGDTEQLHEALKSHGFAKMGARAKAIAALAEMPASQEELIPVTTTPRSRAQEVARTNAPATAVGTSGKKTSVKKGFFGETRMARGTKVRIQGLKARPELNGCIASVGSYDKDTGRYKVTVDKTPRVGGGTMGGDVLALKPEALEIVGPPPEPDAPVDPLGPLAFPPLCPELTAPAYLTCLIASHVASEARLGAFRRLLASIRAQKPAPPRVMVSWSAETAALAEGVRAALGECTHFLEHVEQPSRLSQFEHFAQLTRRPRSVEWECEWLFFSDDDDVWSEHRTAIFAQGCRDAEEATEALCCRRKARKSGGGGGGGDGGGGGAPAVGAAASSSSSSSAASAPPADAAGVRSALARGAAALTDAQQREDGRRGVAFGAVGSGHYHLAEYFDFAVRRDVLGRWVRRCPQVLLKHKMCDLAFTHTLRDRLASRKEPDEDQPSGSGGGGRGRKPRKQGDGRKGDGSTVFFMPDGPNRDDFGTPHPLVMTMDSLLQGVSLDPRAMPARVLPNSTPLHPLHPLHPLRPPIPTPPRALSIPPLSTHCICSLLLRRVARHRGARLHRLRGHPTGGGPQCRARTHRGGAGALQEPEGPLAVLGPLPGRPEAAPRARARADAHRGRHRTLAGDRS